MLSFVWFNYVWLTSVEPIDYNFNLMGEALFSAAIDADNGTKPLPRYMLEILEEGEGSQDAAYKRTQAHLEALRKRGRQSTVESMERVAPSTGEQRGPPSREQMGFPSRPLFSGQDIMGKPAK